MKQYNGEKAIISLTSWKARINTVSKTIYSLIQKCPGFHIVLCLSEEEFSQKEAELPDDLMLFVENDLIEILWVYKNYKSFKKWIFTADKYKDVPIISADDDCIYTCNYAQELYDKWLTDKTSIWTFHRDKATGFQHGPATIYRPFCFLENAIKEIKPDILNTNHDDVYYGCLANKYGIKIKQVRDFRPYIFHDTISPLSAKGYKTNKTKKIIEKAI